MPKPTPAVLLLAALLLSGCGGARFLVPDGKVVAQDRDFLVVAAGTSDSLRSLAATYLDDPSLDWVIAEVNQIKRIKPGQQVVIPRRPINQSAVFEDGYQTVPILAYHGITADGEACRKVSVTKKAFARQMAYLKDEGFTVIGFDDLIGFMKGRRSLPKKSVIITIDDGFRSSYDIAFPILRKHGYKATVFVYTDFIGAPSGLSWPQMKEMVSSGLIDIQPHSKTHADLTKRKDGESKSAYLKRVREEVRLSKKTLSRLDIPMHTFSYPYGAENEAVVEVVKSEGFDLGVTVTRGGNPSFANPYVLRRTQIYCKNNLTTFAKRLETYKRLAAK